MYRLYLKRVLDILISGLGLIILSPVFLIISISLSLKYRGSPFFSQMRPGLNERIFKLFKFKTMTDGLGSDGLLLPDALRITTVGSFLRKTSLDELPQLINVIIGDMSLIGPRPLLARYLPYYSAKEKLRHKVRPGITGWAQVNGRNISTWDDRLASDVYYCENLSFKLDVLILVKTIKSVLSARDVVIDPDSIMDPLDIERKKIALYRSSCTSCVILIIKSCLMLYASA
jgi:undecaprenyl phosphate N,N'-diacetylbacillosamine 1-phosphate transferase